MYIKIPNTYSSDAEWIAFYNALSNRFNFFGSFGTFNKDVNTYFTKVFYQRYDRNRELGNDLRKLLTSKNIDYSYGAWDTLKNLGDASLDKLEGAYKIFSIVVLLVIIIAIVGGVIFVKNYATALGGGGVKPQVVPQS